MTLPMGEDMVERAKGIHGCFGRLVASEHRIMGCGPATGHIFTPIALCRTIEIATAMVDAINATITEVLGAEHG